MTSSKENLYSVRFYNEDGQFEAVKHDAEGKVKGYYSWGNEQIGDTDEATPITRSLLEAAHLPPEYIDERTGVDEDSLDDARNLSGQDLPSLESAQEAVRYWRYGHKRDAGSNAPSNTEAIPSVDTLTFEELSDRLATLAVIMKVLKGREGITEEYVQSRTKDAADMLTYALEHNDTIAGNTYHVEVVEMAANNIRENGLQDVHRTGPANRVADCRNYLYYYDKDIS